MARKKVFDAVSRCQYCIEVSNFVVTYYLFLGFFFDQAKINIGRQFVKKAFELQTLKGNFKTYV